MFLKNNNLKIKLGFICLLIITAIASYNLFFNNYFIKNNLVTRLYISPSDQILDWDYDMNAYQSAIRRLTTNLYLYSTEYLDSKIKNEIDIKENTLLIKFVLTEPYFILSTYGQEKDLEVQKKYHSLFNQYISEIYDKKIFQKQDILNSSNRKIISYDYLPFLIILILLDFLYFIQFKSIIQKIKVKKKNSNL